MKSELTKEQSQHLIDLGISKDYASWRVIDIDVDINMPLERLIEESKVEPYFTLNSILEILPNNIGERNRIVESGERGHFAYYCGANGSLDWKSAKEELIDSLYELVCWCIENNYINTKTQ